MTVVTLPQGRIEGAVTVTRRTEVESYLGIPFAAAADGGNRYRAPQPADWSGTLDARHTGPAAPQNPDPIMNAGGFWQPKTDEARCLNLNVWTPGADDRRRPVMVWTHGGAYISGSNASGFNGGAELAGAMDVVVVSANYRLGALGFLALDHLLGDDYADAANLALLDQLAALRWVRENIAAFGGDPDAVTIFGQSAGGGMIGTLLGSPAATGLFRRAIMQSGTAERARDADASRAVTAEVLDALGIAERDAEQLLTLPVARILEAQSTVLAAHAARTVGLALPFIPTIGHPSLPQLPLDAVREGLHSDVDLLAGTNLNEASLFTVLRPPEAAGGQEDPGVLADRVIREDVGSDAIDAYWDALDDELGHKPTDAEAYEAALSDRLYRQPTNRLLDARSSASGRTFAYLFTWSSPMMDGALGSCHALDVPFVFRQLHRLESATLVGDNPPKELSEWMSGAWVEFARRGAPQSPALPTWPAYEPGSRRTMILDRRPQVAEDPRGGLRRIWNKEAVNA